ncbi:hypothetical protein [Peloplasma aerotolerans]|uniref:Uncharacterized protein n=1 Tax=Peloplasma aerotolerans TaxID=3044389 RepID=A0AAW6U849_9MOLU|nr:hypothetical protein [Mariniplasma sp. M4Ah]MDI6453115.1 hypothetical protein [Mariniplasma sp. M4Ah]
MRKVFSILVLAVLALVLSACWPAEVGVETHFNADGSGTRVIIIDVMDDLLSTTPITNPDDPDGTEGKGAVLNDKHVDGGVIAIQAWLEANAPSFMTVHDPEVAGYHRYFKMSFDFSSFDDFLDKYEQLVNLSPNLSWSDFDADEKPTLEVTGGLTRTLTFKESRAIVEASLDWAIDGIWNDIYDEADLAGFVTKADISALANYTVTIGDGEYEELRHYDPNAVDGDGTGKVIFVENDSFTVVGQATNVGLLVGIIVGAVAVIAGGVFLVLKLKK